MKLNSLATTLDRVRDENHALLERLIKIQDDERVQIARDLHDEVGPCLFSIRAGVSTLASVTSPAALDIERMQNASREIGAAGEALQDVIRRMLDQLRPPGLAELGLEAALRGLIAHWQGVRSDVSIALETPHDLLSIDETVRLTAYRIVQESLTNIFRHASARLAQVKIEFEEAYSRDDAGVTDEAALVLHISIADDGVGIGERQGMGRSLLGMTERVKALNGRIEVKDRLGGGTRIDAFLPLPEEEDSDD
jgi:two-component system sensor histidine kinase UhpB